MRYKGGALRDVKVNPSKVALFARRAPIYVGAAALAAALLLYVAFREPALSGPLLPEYSVAASETETRGTADAQAAPPPPAPPAPAAPPALVLRGGKDADFEIVARPATAAKKVVAYAFAIGEGEPNPIEATIEVAPEGAVRIRGRARALEDAREVRVVLGIANDSIERYEDALSRARDGKSDAKVRVLVVGITRP